MSENNEIKEPLNKNYNVPKLRFDKFKNDNLNCDILSQIATLSKGNGLSKDDLSQDGNKCILYGELYTRYLGYIDTIISKTKTILSKPKLSKSGDIIMPLSGETPTDISNSAVVPEDNVILGGDLLVITPKKNIDSLFLSLYLSNCKKKEIAKKSCGISIIHSHKEDIAKLTINYPSLAEQYYISTFLKKLTKKTDIVLKKIDILKKYKEGFTKRLAKALNTDEIALSSICSITTGKMDANAMNQQGKYKFFTCSREDYFIDTYAFDCEALLISGNGEVGLTKYYNGKFNAYQRTYVLYNLKRNAKFIKLFIDLQINTIIRKETNKGAMPYIRLTTFNKITIPNIDPSLEYLISIAIDKIDKKIELLQNHARVLNNIKNNLLSSLFI